MTIRQTIRGGIHRLLQHTWLVIVPAVLCFAAAAIYATGADDQYEATAILSIRTTKSSDALMRSAVVDSARDMIRSIRERMLGYDVLYQVATKLDPFPSLKGDTERTIDRLRRLVKIRINGSSNTITVQFGMSEGPEPAKMCEDVIQEIIALYTAEQSSSLTLEGQNIEEFLANNQKEYTAKLEQLKARLTSFRLENAGALPEDEPLNREMIRTQERRIADAEASKDRNRVSRDNIQLELARVQEDLRRINEEFEGDVEISRMQDYLLGLRKELIAAGETHTDDSDVVKELKGHIERTEDAIRELKDSKRASNDGQTGVARLYRSLIESRERGLKMLDEQDALANKSIATAQAEIVACQNRIEQGKKLAATYAAMEREVEDAKAWRDRLYQKLQDAQFQMKFQKRESAIPIETIGAPRAGSQPIGPKRLEMSLMGLALGLAVGVGLAFLKEKFNTSIRQSSDLRLLLPGAVVVTLPDIQGTGVRVSRVLGNAFLAAATLAVFATATGILGIRMGWWGNMSTIEPLLPWIPKL